MGFDVGGEEWFYNGRNAPIITPTGATARGSAHNTTATLWYISAPLLCNGEGVSPQPLRRHLHFRLQYYLRFDWWRYGLV